MKRSLFLGVALLLAAFPALDAAEENIALKKQVVGSFEKLTVLTDGVIDENNYTEIADFKDTDKFFIVVMGQAKYIDSMKIHWVKGYEPASFRIEFSRNLFNWEKGKTYSFQASGGQKNTVTTSHKFDGTAAFFIRVTVLKPKQKSVRISEAELFSASGLKMTITSVKVENLTEHSADIVFVTSIPSVAYLRFGESRITLNQNIGVESDIHDIHKVSTSGLLKGTEYFYQPVARDLNGNLIIGSVASFKTKGIPLPKIVNLAVEKASPFSVELAWGFNVPCRMELGIEKAAAEPVKRHETKALKSAGRLRIGKLMPETKYRYRITGTDKFNNRTVQEGDFTTPAENIALGKKAYGTFYYPVDGYGIKYDFALFKRITDGNRDMEGMVESGNVATGDQMAIVDLGNDFKIRNATVIWRGIAYSRAFNLDVSKDMKNWTGVKKGIDARKDGSKILSRGEHGLFLRTVDVNCSGTEARYVRILLPKGSAAGSDLPFDAKPFLQLAEIEAYKIPDYAEPSYQVEELK